MVKAAQVASSQEFLELLEKSGLLTEQQLGEARSLAGQSGDAKAFARQLLSRSFVTKWQATQLLNGFGQFSVGKYRLLDQLGVGRLGICQAAPCRNAYVDTSTNRSRRYCTMSIRKGSGSTW